MGLFTHLAGMTSASNSATKCLLIILLDGGMPSAVAIVSPVNDGSSTTRPPCTPLSVVIRLSTTWPTLLSRISLANRQAQTERTNIPFRLSANSPKSILWAHRINLWLVQTKGSASTFSHWCRLTASAYDKQRCYKNWTMIDQLG